MLSKELEEFVSMSRYAGERFDLVQAGGGNTSVKLDDGRMYIKASGFLLSEINNEKGYVVVDNKKVLEILDSEEVVLEKDKKVRDVKSSKKITETIIGDVIKPSIETFLHSLLLKYTLHVHSISVNILTSHTNWLEKVMQLGDDILPIKYETPGIDLALEMKEQLNIFFQKNNKTPKVICLQNHGLIITSNDYSEIEEITEKIVCKAEELCNVNFESYRNVTSISKAVNTVSLSPQMSYYVNDRYINEMLKKQRDAFFVKPFSPDGYVFCGYKALDLGEHINLDKIKNYINSYKETPKVVILNNKIYILSADLKKAKMIEDVLKNNLIILEALKDDVNFLETEEINYLANWDAEKYRQKL